NAFFSHQQHAISSTTTASPRDIGYILTIKVQVSHPERSLSPPRPPPRASSAGRPQLPRHHRPHPHHEQQPRPPWATAWEVRPIPARPAEPEVGTVREPVQRERWATATEARKGSGPRREAPRRAP